MKGTETPISSRCSLPSIVDKSTKTNSAVLQYLFTALVSDPLIPWNPREPSGSHCDMGVPPVLAQRSRAGRPCHHESPKKTYHLISSTPQCRLVRIRSSEP